MKIALDTNVLVYVEQSHGDPREEQARDLIDRLGDEEVVIPIQALGELFAVLTRKIRLSRQTAMIAIESWGATGQWAATSPSAFRNALALSRNADLQIWDAVILSVAEEAGCRILLSEDLQDGFVWRGVTVCNPFALTPHPLLADLLERAA